MTCAWRNTNSSMISEGWLLPLSSSDITLGQHERCHLPSISPSNHTGQAGQTRWRPFCHRGEPNSEAATDHPQQVSPKSAQSHHPRPHIPRILVPIHASKTHRQNRNHHQAVDSTFISQCTDETEIPPAVFTPWRAQARSKGTIQNNHQCHCRDETP